MSKYYECKYEHSDCKGNHEDDCAKRMLLLYEIEKLKEENVELRFETVRAFERGQKFPCNLDCEDCTEKCRAWQNGYNATCERECDNCEVIADILWGINRQTFCILSRMRTKIGEWYRMSKYTEAIESLGTIFKCHACDMEVANFIIRDYSTEH